MLRALSLARGALQGPSSFSLASRKVRNSSPAPPCTLSSFWCLSSSVSLGSLLLQASPLLFVLVWEAVEVPSSWTQPDSVLSPPAGWPGPAPSVSELERRRLEEALEAAQGEARGAQLREEQLQAECERLQEELKQLQETRAQVSDSGHRPGPLLWYLCSSVEAWGLLEIALRGLRLLLWVRPSLGTVEKGSPDPMRLASDLSVFSLRIWPPTSRSGRWRG